MTVLRRGARILAVLLATAGAARHAAADVPSTVEMPAAQAALTRLFEAPAAKPEWFAPAFLEDVPLAQINAVLSNVAKRYGAFRSVDGSGLDYKVHLTQGSVNVRVVVDHTGQIAALMITP